MSLVEGYETRFARMVQAELSSFLDEDLSYDSNDNEDELVDLIPGYLSIIGKNNFDLNQVSNEKLKGKLINLKNLYNTSQGEVEVTELYKKVFKETIERFIKREEQFATKEPHKSELEEILDGMDPELAQFKTALCKRYTNNQMETIYLKNEGSVKNLIFDITLYKIPQESIEEYFSGVELLALNANLNYFRTWHIILNLTDNWDTLFKGRFVEIVKRAIPLINALSQEGRFDDRPGWILTKTASKDTRSI